MSNNIKEKQEELKIWITKIGMTQKYFIEQYNLTPELNGSTIQNACISGNLNLVKYLID